MELNGALSNPFETDKRPLIRASTLCQRLLDGALRSPPKPHPRSPRPVPLHQVVTLVLAEVGRPIRVGEIHAAAEQRLDQHLLRNSLKAALAAGAGLDTPRFRRACRGVYELIRAT
jgi:hypothetical protein